MLCSPATRQAIRAAALILLALIFAGCERAPERPTLNLWIGDWNTDTRALLDDKIIPAFEKAHGVDVKIEYLSWTHLDEKLTISFAGGVQPDVFQIGAEYVGSMAYRDQAQILDDYVKDWPQTSDFIPAAWSTVSAGGHVYGVPYLSAPRLLVYRKDLYEKAGLPYPPRTWEEWAKAGQALTTRRSRGAIERAGIYFGPSGNWQYFAQFLWQNGGDFLTPDGKRAAFNSPAGVAALQYYVDLIRKYKVCPPEGISSAAASVPLFAAGQAAQEINNQFAIKNVLKYSKDFGLKDVGVAMPPTAGKPVVAVYTDWLAMSAQSRHKELAWELMKFLTRPDNLIAYNETQYFIPPIRSAASSDYVKNTPFMPFFMKAMEEHGRSLPPIPEWFEMRAGLKTAVDQALFGDKTAKQALDEYARQVDKMIALRLKQDIGKSPAPGS
jgi:ABC-type glycerol-3-phosphate transport system substrate-binding protein